MKWNERVRWMPVLMFLMAAGPTMLALAQHASSLNPARQAFQQHDLEGTDEIIDGLLAGELTDDDRSEALPVRCCSPCS